MASSQRLTANKRPPPCPSGNRHNYTPLLKWYSFRFTITTCNKRLTKIIFNKISIQFFSCSPRSVHQSRVIVRLRVYWFLIHRYYAWGFAQKFLREFLTTLSLLIKIFMSPQGWYVVFPPLFGRVGVHLRTQARLPSTHSAETLPTSNTSAHPLFVSRRRFHLSNCSPGEQSYCQQVTSPRRQRSVPTAQILFQPVHITPTNIVVH